MPTSRQTAQRLQTATALRAPGRIDELVLDTQPVGQRGPVPARLRLEQVAHPRQAIRLGEPPLDPALRSHATTIRRGAAFVQPYLWAMGSTSPSADGACSLAVNHARGNLASSVAGALRLPESVRCASGSSARPARSGVDTAEW